MAKRRKKITAVNKVRAAISTNESLGAMLDRNESVSYRTLTECVHRHIDENTERIEMDETYPVQSKGMSALIRK